MKYANKMMTLALLGATVCASQAVMAQTRDRGPAYPGGGTVVRYGPKTDFTTTLFNGESRRCTQAAGCNFTFRTTSFSIPIARNLRTSSGAEFQRFLNQKFSGSYSAQPKTFNVRVANGRTAQVTGVEFRRRTGGYFEGVFLRNVALNGRLITYRWSSQATYGNWSGDIANVLPYHKIVIR